MLLWCISGSEREGGEGVEEGGREEGEEGRGGREGREGERERGGGRQRGERDIQEVKTGGWVHTCYLVTPLSEEENTTGNTVPTLRIAGRHIMVTSTINRR